MKHAILILCLWLSWSSAAAQFRMIGTATWTTLTDSTYAATINFQPDLTNNGYLATQVVDGFRMFTGTEQVYTVNVNEMLSTFSSIVAVVTEYNGDHGVPIGQVMVYDPAGRATIPQAPYGNTGSTSQMQAAVDTYNARLVGTAGVDLSPYSTRAELADSTAAIRSDFPVGGAVIDSTRLTQDSILVYYQDGAEVGRDTIAGVGGGTGGGTITLSGDVTGSGTTAITTTIAAGAVGPDELASTAVTPGSYTSADITVDADGRITSAANGSGGGGGISGSGTTNYLPKWTSGTVLGNSLITDDATNISFLGGWIPKSWTTGGRPTGVTSLTGYNSTLGRLESYYNAEWNGLSSTLADVSANSTTTTKSLYTMTSGQNVEFRRSGASPLLYLDEANGRIGIGTATPSYSLDILGPISGANHTFIELEKPANGVGRWGIATIGGDFRILNLNDANKYLNFSTTGKLGINSITGTNTIDLNGSYGASLSGLNAVKLIELTNINGPYVWHTMVTGTGSIYTPGSLIFSGVTSGGKVVIDQLGKIGVGQSKPTALLHLKAGTATANTSPLKFTSGTNLTTPEAGAVEWDGTNLFITQTTGPTRKTIAYVDTDDGSASATTDGSGDITVSHTLGSAGITVTATTTGTTFYHVQVHSKTTTTFKIRFFDAAGAAVTSTAVTADWIAKLQ